MLYNLLTFFQQIFRPPLDIYDVLIRINPQCNIRKYHQVDCTEKVESKEENLHYPMKNLNKLSKNTPAIPVTGFDPLQCYLNELRVFIFYCLSKHIV